MAVRNFSGTNQWIRLAIGTLNGIQGGAITVAAIAKVAANNSYRPLLTFDAGGATGTNTRRSVARYSSNNMGFDSSGGEFSAALTWQIADDWCLVAWTKAAGSVDIRCHKYVYATDTWTHTDGGSAGDDGTAVTNVKIGQWYNSADDYSGRMALVGAWKRALSDADLEAMTADLASWEAETPDALWPLNQASTDTAVTDITGNGANQALNNGTTVATGDDPPFSFAAGAEVELDGIGQAAADAEGTLARSRAVAGTAPAADDSTGTLATVRALSGAGQQADAAAGTLAAARAYAGAGTAAGGATGQLGRARAASGAGATAASATGSLSLTRALAGQAPAAGSAAANLGRDRGLTGTAPAAADGTADLTTSGDILLAGTAPAAGSAAGTLAVARPLAGVGPAVATAVGELTVTAPSVVDLSGLACTAAAATGVLAVARPLAGVSATASWAVGNLGQVSAGGTVSLAPALLSTATLAQVATPSATAVRQLVPTAGGVA